MTYPVHIRKNILAEPKHRIFCEVVARHRISPNTPLFT